MLKSAEAAEWIPLMDYAIKRGVSLSTLRRHIKANKVLYKVENGRYLLFNDAEIELPAQGESMAVLQLKAELQKAREEIAELKTLIAFYEESLPTEH